MFQSHLKDYHSVSRKSFWLADYCRTAVANSRMLSSCCKQLVKRCRQIHLSPRFGSKPPNSFDMSRRMVLTSTYSSSSIFGSIKMPPIDGSISDDSDDDTSDSDIEKKKEEIDKPDEDDDEAGNVSKKAIEEIEIPMTAEEEEEALEARKRYYARKVSGELDEEEEPEVAGFVPRREKLIDDLGRSYGTGKRKTSVARVWIKDGSGLFIVNDKRLTDYFTPMDRELCLGAFIASQTAGLFDVWCTVKGGGTSGQAGAIRLGTARALEAFNPNYRELLAPAGMLTRDSRRVERKKPGQKKARKQFQWVKR